MMAGLAAGGNWMAALPALAPALIMLIGRRITPGWLPTVSLVFSTGLAAVGILSGVPPFLLTLGVMAALASWDLALVENSLRAGPPQHTAFFEGGHLQSLGLAIGLGVLVVGAGRAVQLSLPFGVLILLVVLILICLDWLIYTQVHQG